LQNISGTSAAIWWQKLATGIPLLFTIFKVSLWQPQKSADSSRFSGLHHRPRVEQADQHLQRRRRRPEASARHRRHQRRRLRLHRRDQPVQDLEAERR